MPTKGIGATAASARSPRPGLPPKRSKAQLASHASQSWRMTATLRVAGPFQRVASRHMMEWGMATLKLPYSALKQKGLCLALLSTGLPVKVKIGQ